MAAFGVPMKGSWRAPHPFGASGGLRPRGAKRTYGMNVESVSSVRRVGLYSAETQPA